MEPRLQRRVQRYGWDLAAADYEPLWRSQLRCAQAAMLQHVALAPGEQVLDVACGTGIVSFDAARAVGPGGGVLGVDLSGRMVEAATRQAREHQWPNAHFARMDAEALDLLDAQFDVVLCALGLMYLPDPAQAVREMRRVLRPGGRLGLAVWGERSRCGWSSLFEIVDAEVQSEVCPLFFGLGRHGALERLCVESGFRGVEHQRIAATLDYGSAGEACEAAFAGGPVALAWSRFDAGTRARARARYLLSIEAWRQGSGYRIPGEFVVATARS
ncbi:MAG TPA: class I SAM-dependent methyltransferase [Rubrivivax sp.]